MCRRHASISARCRRALGERWVQCVWMRVKRCVLGREAGGGVEEAEAEA